MGGSVAGLPLEVLLSPWLLGLLGLAVGSFLNVVVHRLPLMLERQWWGDAVAQVGDAESHRRVFERGAPQALLKAAADADKAIEALHPLSLARPASRCPHCGHRIRWFENVPVLSWSACEAAARRAGHRLRCAIRSSSSVRPCFSRSWPGGLVHCLRPRYGAPWPQRCSRWR